MVSTLSVKNFGPIKDISIQLKNVNVFIGPQASGKSAILAAVGVPHQRPAHELVTVVDGVHLFN